MSNTEENRRHEEVREDVIIAYQEVMNKLKVMKSDDENDDREFDYDFETEDSANLNAEDQQEEHAQGDNVIELAARETLDVVARSLAELKISIPKTLEDIKGKLTAELERIDLLKKARNEIEKDLENSYQIKKVATTLSSLILAKNEKAADLERELAEQKKRNENETTSMQNERIREQMEYVEKRDALRRADQEQYEKLKQELIRELQESYRIFEEDCALKKAHLDAREEEHELWKKRQAKILLDEQEFRRLQQIEANFPHELDVAVKNAEAVLTEQLNRKSNYDLKMAEISWNSERNMLTQKIEALQQQIDQYRDLNKGY